MRRTESVSVIFSSSDPKPSLQLQKWCHLGAQVRERGPGLQHRVQRGGQQVRGLCTRPPQEHDHKQAKHNIIYIDLTSGFNIDLINLPIRGQDQFIEAILTLQITLTITQPGK